MAGRPAPASRQVRLPRSKDGWHVVRYGVLSDGQLAILYADADVLAAERTDRYHHTVDELGRVVAGALARFEIISDGSAIRGPTFPLMDPFPVFDRFPDGRWLVANARTLHGNNGRLFSAEGAELRRVMLGDGINHLKIDALSRIWVGWFDEGIFGNSQWRYPGLKWPPSSYGVVGFDEHGTMVEHLSLDSIADCYALNVSGPTAWSYTYTDFPIACIGGELGQRTWPTSLRGGSAIAVDFPKVLVAGGYSEEGNRVVLVRLDNDGVDVLSEWRLRYEIQSHRLQVDFMDGRGDELHVIHDGVWHSWRVRDFEAARSN